MYTLLRLDRVLALAAGVHAAAKSEQRRFRCLVACREQLGPGGGVSGQSSRQHSRHSSSRGSVQDSQAYHSTGVRLQDTAQQWQAGFLSNYWAAWRAVLPGPITAGLGADFGEKGIVGALVVDTLGDHTPPVRTPGGGKRRRPRLAYVSNVAVASGARRRGIGALLMQQAEQVAAEWGATAVMLHVDASNDAASELYRQKRYRLLAEPRRSWLAEAVNVHAGKRMMMKRLRGAVGISSRRSNDTTKGSARRIVRMAEGRQQ
jgi:ribosomal protein S18 acetylase RimI-like enzyme